MTPGEDIAAATEHQPRVRAALVAALRGTGASHAYLFHGPAGAGKRPAARAFAAELLAVGAREAGLSPSEAEDARRRALLDPSPHPDLVWVAPDGLQHRVEEIRERVIRLATRRPFEGGRRVFVIEAAEAMRDEAQNALLKTLEEPPPYVHLILISRAVEEVLPTVRSRCHEIEFAALPAPVVEASLAADPSVGGTSASPQELRAVARLSGGDGERARFLISDTGRALRASVEAYLASLLEPAPADQDPWEALLKTAETAGEEAEGRVQERLDQEAELGIKTSKTESGQALRRESRRARTQVLDLSLELMQSWLRDLSVIAVGAPDLTHNSDRLEALRQQLPLVREGGPRQAITLIADYRRRLRLNVSEELAFEALHSLLRRSLSRSSFA